MMAEPQDARWKALQVLAGTAPISTEVPEYEDIPPAPKSWSQRAIDPLESHRLPVHVPSQEPELEAEAQKMVGHPGAVQSIYNYLAKDPGNYALAPPMIAVSEATVPLFQKALQEAEVLGNTGNPLVDKARAWLATRYPRFAAQAPVYPAGEGSLPSNVRGIFYGGGRPYVHLNSEALSKTADPLAEAIRTLAHEMTHARQFVKMGPSEMAAQHAIPYDERMIERLARAAGGTAKESYMKYLQYLAGLK